MMAVPAARGLHTPLAPKSGSVRNSLRSDSGRFFIRFRHQRRVAIDGDPHSNCNCNGNGNGNCNGNGNGNCNGNGTCNGMQRAQGPFDTLAARALRANGVKGPQRTTATATATATVAARRYKQPQQSLRGPDHSQGRLTISTAAAYYAPTRQA